jgi:hypothetical protein
VSDFLYITVAKIETIVEPNCMANNLNRIVITRVNICIFHAWIITCFGISPSTWQYLDEAQRTKK